MDIEECAYVCAWCREPLTFVEWPCRFGSDHRHMRCTACSPAEFAACLRLLPQRPTTSDGGAMAFGNITRTLAIPRESTATYTFHRFPLCDAGPPSITISHAGDGTPSYSRATWHAANAQRSAFMSGDQTITDSRVKQGQMDHARRVADHCVRSWLNVVEDGCTDLAPCTPDKVHEFLCAIIESDGGRDMYAEFRAWAENPDNFRIAGSRQTGDLGKQ